MLLSGVVAPNLTDVFGERLKRIGLMIVLRDSYDGGHYTTRVWCIFEVYTATMHNIPISVALPGASKAEFHKKLKDRHFSEIAASLTPLMPRGRKQPFQSDEDAIKSLIKETTGSLLSTRQ